jgi:hypothetical protein
MLGRGDLVGIGLADRGDVGAVVDAALQEGDLAVELGAVDREGEVGNPERRHAAGLVEALIGEVVDGQDRGRGEPLPAHVARRERGGPVVDVDDVGFPVGVGLAGRDLGRRQRKPGEADVVVDEIAAREGAVGRAFAIIELVAEHGVDGEPVRRAETAERPGRQARRARHFADDVHGGAGGADLAEAGEQNADVAEGAQLSRQRGRDLAEAAGLDEIAHLGGDEEQARRTGKLGARVGSTVLHGLRIGQRVARGGGAAVDARFLHRLGHSALPRQL